MGYINQLDRVDSIPPSIRNYPFSFPFQKQQALMSLSPTLPPNNFKKENKKTIKGKQSVCWA
jgi:hypothetical protein